MLRLILISLSFVFATASIAQNKEIVFLDKNQLEWLNNEVADLNAAVSLLEEGRSNSDRSTINQASIKIKRSFMRFNSTGLRMYEKMAASLDPAKLAEKDAPIQGDNSISNYQLQIERFRKVKNLEEMRLSTADVDSFLENISEIKDLSDILAVHNYDFNSSELKQIEMKSVKNALKAATANNILLINNAIN